MSSNKPLSVTDFLDPTVPIVNHTPYALDDLIAMGKRLYNNKRDYLFINNYLGKHIPVKVSLVSRLFDQLADRIARALSGKRVLIIGFAETATALSQSIMRYLMANSHVEPVYYAQTTRELVNTDGIPNDMYCLAFKEEHSHAPSQVLYLHKDIATFDTVLFIDDEITTGNTILNTIKTLGYETDYVVASILNWQNEASKTAFEKASIKTISLVSGSLKQDTPTIPVEDDHNHVTHVTYSSHDGIPNNITYYDARFGQHAVDWYANHKAQRTALLEVLANSDQSIHTVDEVIGTEEYMYTGMLLASMLDKPFRATTRSPIAVDDVHITNRLELPSFYDVTRQTYLYNIDPSKSYLLVTDVAEAHVTDHIKGIGLSHVLTHSISLSSASYTLNRVKTSYLAKDVCVLLQDVKGNVPVLDTLEREKLNQSGVHYSEMLPVEYEPSEDYRRLYQESLMSLAKETGKAVSNLADKIYNRHGKNVVLVSLARAGTPIGILLKRCFQAKYHIDPPHYTISIIRGKGIDVHAMHLIMERHDPKDIQFVDGWVGKGAINDVLSQEVASLNTAIDPELAVLSDPASVTSLYGTRQDFLIPSACLNSTVSGLFSRTVKTKHMTDMELHGAVYYEDNKDVDLSYDFINHVVPYFDQPPHHPNDFTFSPSQAEQDESFKGLDEVLEIAKQYGIDDYTKVKPGVGETTRVLLRRMPDRILVNPNADDKYLKHIYQLAKEKQVLIETYPFKKYNVCGLIKDVSDL